MSLPKKGSSTITVDDVVYRWVVSGNDGFLDLVVQHVDGQGQRLTVQFNCPYGDTYLEITPQGAHEHAEITPQGVRKHLEITPRVVREIILLALDKGWEPRKRGQQPYYRYVDGRLVPIKDIVSSWPRHDS